MRVYRSRGTPGFDALAPSRVRSGASKTLPRDCPDVKPFLILQLRPETEASDDEFEAMLRKGGLEESRARRMRLDQEPRPDDLDLRDYAGGIVGGGPGCVSDPEDQKTRVESRIESEVFRLMPGITAADFPFLGCCYGIGILAHHVGAKVGKDRYSEQVGAVHVRMTVGADRIVTPRAD